MSNKLLSTCLLGASLVLFSYAGSAVPMNVSMEGVLTDSWHEDFSTGDSWSASFVVESGNVRSSACDGALPCNRIYPVSGEFNIGSTSLPVNSDMFSFFSSDAPLIRSVSNACCDINGERSDFISLDAHAGTYEVLPSLYANSLAIDLEAIGGALFPDPMDNFVESWTSLGIDDFTTAEMTLFGSDIPADSRGSGIFTGNLSSFSVASTAAPVPEPSAILLFIPGILGLAFAGRARRRT